MKKIVFLTLVLAFFSCNTNDAVKYNNEIIKEQRAIVKKISRLREMLNDGELGKKEIKKINSLYDQTIFQLDSAIQKVKAMDDFEDDASLKIAAVSLFENYKNVVEKDYKQVIELYKLPKSLYGKEEEQKAKEIIRNANLTLKTAQQEFIKAQREFAEKHNIKIKKTKKVKN